MKVVHEPEEWSEELSCTLCGVSVLITEEDLAFSRFVDNSKGEYWFAGHPGHPRVYMKCPTQGCTRDLFPTTCPDHIFNRVRGTDR